MKNYILAIGWGGDGNGTGPIEFEIIDGKVVIDLELFTELNNEYEIIKDEEEQKNMYLL